MPCSRAGALALALIDSGAFDFLAGVLVALPSAALTAPLVNIAQTAEAISAPLTVFFIRFSLALVLRCEAQCGLKRKALRTLCGPGNPNGTLDSLATLGLIGTPTAWRERSVSNAMRARSDLAGRRCNHRTDTGNVETDSIHARSRGHVERSPVFVSPGHVRGKLSGLNRS
jgi:hypothetical protein